MYAITLLQERVSASVAARDVRSTMSEIRERNSGLPKFLKKQRTRQRLSVPHS